MERAMGIEPTSEAWEASILPLYDARSAGCAILGGTKGGDGTNDFGWGGGDRSYKKFSLEEKINSPTCCAAQ